MLHSTHSSEKTDAAISLPDLAKMAEGFLLSGEIDQHSACTLGARRDILNKLMWFLRRKGVESCGVHELRQFLAYVTNGHKEPGGRWDNPRMTRPVRPRTVRDYHGHLRTFFRWVVAEGALASSPMERIPVPESRSDQIQPFTEAQVNALIAAAKRSNHPRRDEAIVWFLVDTGVRASELCSLKIGDVDTSARRVTVLGKGNKYRTITYSKTAANALWAYLKEDRREPTDPLFESERGEALTRSGLGQLIRRLGRAAQINSARCSPHTFRHTFAVTFLRNGANQFALMQMLGHNDIKMTARYVQLASADVENAHRQYSPADSIKKGGKR